MKQAVIDLNVVSCDTPDVESIHLASKGCRAAPRAGDIVLYEQTEHEVGLEQINMDDLEQGQAVEQIDSDPLDPQLEQIVLDELEEVQQVEKISYLSPDGKRRGLSHNDEGLIEPPCVGMIFNQLAEIDQYFRRYAKQQGFGVVLGSAARRQVDGVYIDELRNCTWKCERAGKKDTRRRVNGKKVNCVGPKGVKFVTRGSKKCQCPVRVYTSKNEDGDWVLRTVILDHVGHAPTPRKANFVPQYRKEEITPAVARRLFNDRLSGIRTTHSFKSMLKERNGYENTKFTERDLRNFYARTQRAKIEMEGGDANALVNYFKKMAADNKDFFHRERVDRGTRLKDVMWVDARSRAAYLEFSDVVCFDSTYITNRYKLPFAVFVGVNHHGQTILFGCALLSHEDTETFEWLFSCWLECMHGVAPGGILTDQCAAMRKALSKVMPGTRHRWCLWHILMKFPKYLRQYTEYEQIKEDLHSVIYDSLSPEEFDKYWPSVIAKYGLENNEWLQGLFEEREMWIPAHLKHMFWAGMTSTQRSESINSFFDGYVNKNTMLHEFGTQYFAAMEARVQAEKEADENDSVVQELVGVFPFEVEFQKLYTKQKFIQFQTECLKLVYVDHLERKPVNEHITEHLLEDRIWYKDKTTRKDIPTERTSQYVVSFDSSNDEAWCVCGMFDSHGILCRHLIKVYNIRKVKKIPPKFILRRWSKNIERLHVKVLVMYHDTRKSEEVKRFDRAILEFELLGLLAAESDENLDFVLKLINGAYKKLESKKKNVEAGHLIDGPLSQLGDNITVVTPDSVNKRRSVNDQNVCESVAKKSKTPGSADSVQCEREAVVIKDPPMPVKPRHRTTNTRFKSIVEVKTTAKAKYRAKKKVDENTSTRVVQDNGKSTKKSKENTKRKGKNATTQQAAEIDTSFDPTVAVEYLLNSHVLSTGASSDVLVSTEASEVQQSNLSANLLYASDSMFSHTHGGNQGRGGVHTMQLLN